MDDAEPAVRTLLLTDLVDSTRLVETLGDRRAAELFAAHDDRARDLLPAHGGREIDRTDGFLHLFEQPGDAAAYAGAYLSALHELSDRFEVPLAARVGIHADFVILRENRPEHVARGAKPLEVEGLAKAIAARVMSVAAAGQILLTGPARARLGPAVATRSHGFYRLKGVAEPLELFELGADGVFTAPPDNAKVWRVVRQTDGWVPAAPPPHAIPGERDAFVGREDDLAELFRLLDGGARLVSVLGAGGTGKTRLVTRFAWTWLGMWPGGTWFVDLSEARTVDGICHALAHTLEVQLSEGEPLDQLGRALAGRGPALVVLDNFEQVARHARETLGSWLDRAPSTRFVVTTREVLGLRGEQVLALPVLEPERAAELFAVRATQAHRAFRAGPEDRAVIAELVGLLDGLPLAIELAAARVRVMPPSTLLERMGDRFRLLASGGARRDRHATLRATLEWSWDLLDPAEQAALAQLSVFEGGFTLEAAEAVLDLDAWPDAPWAMDAVQALVDKSLVRQVDTRRFDLLVSVQEFAGDRLHQLGGEVEPHRRHGTWFARWGSRDDVESVNRGEAGLALRRERMADLDNLVAASRRAADRGDGETAGLTAIAVRELLYWTGPHSVCVETLSRALASLPAGAPLTVRVGIDLGEACTWARRMDDARATLERALADAEALGDDWLTAWAYRSLGRVEAFVGRPLQALEWLDRAEQILAREGHPRALASVSGTRVAALYSLGRSADGIAVGTIGLARAEACQDHALEASLLANVANCHTAVGRYDEAERHLRKSLEIARRTSMGMVIATTAANLSAVAGSLGRFDECAAWAEEAVRVGRESGAAAPVITGELNLAFIHQTAGRFDRALEAYERIAPLAAEVGAHEQEDGANGGAAVCLAALGRWAEARQRFDRAAASMRERGARLGLATLLAEWAAQEAVVDREAAGRRVDEAEEIADEANSAPRSELRVAIEVARARIAQTA